MVDHATAKYLSDNVGNILAKAMADMATAQPADGVDFLAQWLRIYAEREEEKDKVEKEAQALEAERAKTRARAEHQAAEQWGQEALLASKDQRYQDLMSKFRSTETVFEESYWDELLSVAQETMGATAVYLGLLEEEGLDGVEPAGPCIAYTHTSTGSEWMLDQVLPLETGVTWAALKQNVEEEDFIQANLWRPPRPPPPPEPLEPPPPVEGEEPPPEEPEEPKEVTLPYYPVNIPCVTDVPGVHYFHMMRLGAYLAMPMTFPSYYTSDALADAKRYEETKKAEAKAREEAREQALKEFEEAVAAAEAAGEEPPEPPVEEPVEEKPLVLRGQDKRMVVCMDTLGTNTKMEESRIKDLLDLCDACAACKARAETKYVDEQALIEVDEEARQKLDEAIAQARTEAEAAHQEALDQELAGVEEEEKKDVIQKKFAYERARAVVLAMQEAILDFTKWVVAPPEMLSILAALCFLVGYPKDRVYPKRKSVLKWSKLIDVLDADLFTALGALDVSAERKGLLPEHKLRAIRELVPGNLNEESAKMLWPSFELLFTLLKAACEYRQAALDLRKLDYEKEKKQKEEEGEAFEKPPLEELDDDYVD